ncbi:MAG: hypothetical protein WD992_01415 [Candidatus Levyibacteriota bacterium]
MDNQNQTPLTPQNTTPQPVVPPVAQPQPQPQMAPVSPMPQPQPQPEYQPQPEPAAPPPSQNTGSSKKTLYILGLVVLLLLGVGAYYYFANSLNPATNDTGVAPTVIQQVITQEPTPTVTPIESSADLDGALNQIDGMDPAAVEAELNANTQDSTTFTP